MKTRYGYDMNYISQRSEKTVVSNKGNEDAIGDNEKEEIYSGTKKKEARSCLNNGRKKL